MFAGVIAAWLIIFLVPLVPCAVGMVIAMKMRPSYRLRWFVLGGVVIGVVLSPFIACINFGVFVPENVEAHILDQFMMFFPALIISGAAAGVVCRLILNVETVPHHE
jgi:hypothetical protein